MCVNKRDNLTLGRRNLAPVSDLLSHFHQCFLGQCHSPQLLQTLDSCSGQGSIHYHIITLRHLNPILHRCGRLLSALVTFYCAFLPQDFSICWRIKKKHSKLKNFNDIPARSVSEPAMWSFSQEVSKPVSSLSSCHQVECPCVPEGNCGAFCPLNFLGVNCDDLITLHVRMWQHDL